MPWVHSVHSSVPKWRGGTCVYPETKDEHGPAEEEIVPHANLSRPDFHDGGNIPPRRGGEEGGDNQRKEGQEKHREQIDQSILQRAVNDLSPKSEVQLTSI